MSRMVSDLFFIFKLLDSMSKLPELLICELLIMPQREGDILTKDFPILREAYPIAKIIGR